MNTAAELAVREAALQEAGRLAALVRDAHADVAARFRLTPQNCPAHPCFCSEEAMAADFARGCLFLVCERQAAACGSCGVLKTGSDACRIERLSVLPQHRHQGVGRALVQAAFAQARRLGVTQVEVSILQENAELRRWYERQGFRESGSVRYPHQSFGASFLFAEL